MAILNNLREIKEWVATSKPGTVADWQPNILLRSVPERQPGTVFPSVPNPPRPVSPPIQYASTSGKKNQSRTEHTNSASFIHSSTVDEISSGCNSATVLSGRGNMNEISIPDPKQDHNPNLLHENPKTSLSNLRPRLSLLDDIEVLDDVVIISPFSSKIETSTRKSDKMSLEFTGFSTQKESPQKDNPYSIIDPEKLGITNLLGGIAAQEPKNKRARVEKSSFPKRNDIKAVVNERAIGVFSLLENITKLSQNTCRPTSISSHPLSTDSFPPLRKMPSSNSDREVVALQNYIRLCEAKIDLLTKRNAIHDSTSLSQDAKTLWIKDKFAPRMKTLSFELQAMRSSFAFLTPSLDETNLSNITSDNDVSQVPAPQVVRSSSPVASRDRSSVISFSKDVKVRSNETGHSAKYDALSTTISRGSTDFKANIEEARRIIEEKRNGPPKNQYTGSKNDDDDDDLEDDFGADYLDGLVSSQSNSEKTDLSGFVVSDDEGGRDNLTSADNTYLETQETQQDSHDDSDVFPDDVIDLEARAPTRNDIQDELQDLLSQDNDQVTIEVPDDENVLSADEGLDEGIVSADFTTQLNENRDDIVHIPSEDELDDDDLNGLRELLHVKLEQSQRHLPQLISESDFSDDDDELIQLTKTVLPSSNGLVNENARRVLPGSELFIDEIYDVLNRTFGLQDFRPNQLEAIVSTLQGRDVFVLLPTGGGKSLCFQLPALVKGGKTRGVTVVVSPLISLMQDQVQHLLEKNVRAGMISSKGTAAERNVTFKALTSGQLDLVYLSPEMINNSGRVQKVIEKLHENEMLARVVVDEAHCVSSWGHDFRPDYKGMSFFKENFPNIPVMALTATASEKVRLDIIHNLQMRDPVMLKQSFNRANLFYTIMNKPPAVYEWVRDYIKSKHRGKTGIIYCHSKQSCETTAQKLNEFGISCLFYHAGMNPEERLDVQLQWQENRVQLICATIAFGMGIDKPDVRFVIHMYIPRSLEGYYQETGRAGRDTGESECIMFYSYKDARLLQSLIQRDENLEEAAREMHLAKLRQVVQYCENKTDCRRRQVLHFFNENFDAKNCRRKCDNCCSDNVSITKDVTEDCINIIKMVQIIHSAKVTVLHCQDVYKGSKSKKIVSLGHHQIDYHGLGSHLERGDIERIIFELQSLNALVEYQVMRGGFATSYVRLGADANTILKGKKRILLSFARSNGSSSASKLGLTSKNANASGPTLSASGNGTGIENFRYTDSFVSAREFRNQEELEKENAHFEFSPTKAILPQQAFDGSVTDSNSSAIEYALMELRNYRQLLLAEKGFARPTYYVSDAFLKEMAAKLPTNARDFAKLTNFPKGQPSCFGDFKKLLATLARARKSGLSQEGMASKRPRMSQSSSPYFRKLASKKGHRSQGKGHVKPRSRTLKSSIHSLSRSAKPGGTSASSFVRQMPI